MPTISWRSSQRSRGRNAGGAALIQWRMSSTVQKQIDAVLFDLYGTLVDIEIDTARAETWMRFSDELAGAGIRLGPACLRQRYAALVEAEERQHGQAFVLDPLFFHKLLYDPVRQAPERLVTSFGRRFRELTTRAIQLRSYALPLLDALRRSGCKVGLISNTEGIVTDHDLETLNIHDAFDTVVLSTRVGVKKPDGGIFDIALRALGIQARRALFVGDDHLADFEGATRAGLSPVLLCPANQSGPAKCIKPTLERIMSALERGGWIRPADLSMRLVEPTRGCCPELSRIPAIL